MGAAVIPAGDGELIGDSPERRVEILCDHPALNATWSRFAAGQDGANLHLHHSHMDLFYVLTGELTTRLGAADEQIQVAAGSLVRVPPFVTHGFRNASDAEVTLLNLHAPGGGFNGFMRGMRDGRRVAWDEHDPPAEDERPPGEAAIGATVGIAEHDGVIETVLADEAEVQVSCFDLAPQAKLPRDGDGAVEGIFVLAGELELAGRACGGGTWAHAADGDQLEAGAGDAGARVLLVRVPEPPAA